MLSVAALGVFVFALLALMAGREGLLNLLAAVEPVSGRSGTRRCSRCWALGVLVVQESFERSVETGHIAMASAPAV